MPAGTLYTPGAGYGWQGGVAGGFDRGVASLPPSFTADQQSLYRDAAWGQGTGIFQFAVPMGAANTYAARVYVGDSYQNWGGIAVQLEGGSVVSVDTAAHPFWSYLLSGSDVNGDGVLTLTVTGSVWVVNGIDIIQTAGTSSGTLPASVGPGLAPQLAAEGVARSVNAVSLTSEQLAPIAAEAVRRWEATGLSESQRALLRSVRFEIGDLGAHLGLTAIGGNLIRLDDDGAGRGWFIDATPGDDAEFGSVSGLSSLLATERGAARGYDLLTVVMHEMGHTLGLDSLDASLTPDDLMTATLPVGMRRLPTASAQPVALWLDDVTTPAVTRDDSAARVPVTTDTAVSVVEVPVADRLASGKAAAWLPPTSAGRADDTDDAWTLGGIAVG